VAAANDIPQVAETLAGAFVDDPLWGWAFADPELRHAQQVAFWTFALEGGIDHGWIWTTAAYEAVALWIPPGKPELIDSVADRLVPFVRELTPARADVVLDVIDRFDAARPHRPEHFYLSLLGTHPQHRGNGYGMQLLRSTLDRIDTHGKPAYLESSNPVNLARYESVGFQARGEIRIPDGPIITTMWRE
jgi:GNAT superfamily N-acetyltransferase